MSDRAVVYCRVSTKPQEDKFSLAAQVELGGSHCMARGYQVAAILRETHTGHELDERREMTRLRAMLSRREVDVVVAVALDRLARKPMYQEVIRYEIERAGARVEFVTETYDNTPYGAVLRSLMASFAEVEWSKIQERTMTGKRQRARQGKMVVGGKPLYGYRWVGADRGRYEPHPICAAIVVRIYEEVAGGRSMSQVAIALDRDGVLSPRDQWLVDQGKAPQGRRWGRSTVHDIVHHDAYLGRHVAFRVDVGEKRRDVDPLSGEARSVRIRRARPEDETIPIPDAAPALVTEALAQAARARAAVTKQEAARNYHGPITALLRAGRVVCGVCGRKLHVHRSVTQRHNPYYHCPTHRYNHPEPRCPTPYMPVERLDREVWETIKRRIGRPELITGEWEKRQEDGGMAERTVASLDRQIEDATLQRERLRRSLALTDDDRLQSEIMGDMERCAQRAREIEGERDRLRAMLADREAMRSRVEQFAGWCERVAPTLDEATYEERRLMLFVLGACVTIPERGSPYSWRYEDILGVVEDGAIVTDTSQSIRR